MRTLLAAVAAVSIGSAAAAAPINLDFDENGATAGNIAGDLFVSEGVMIRLLDNGGNPFANSPTLALFDSACAGNGLNPGATACTGDDPDLAQPNPPGQGLVLIANEGSDSDPDDFAGNYSFEFMFTNPTSVDFVQVVDLEESEDVSFRGLTMGGATISLPAVASLIDPPAGDNSLWEFGLQTQQLQKLFIDFKGTSGAIGSLEYTPVPIPASLPLLVGALGLMGFLSRRRRSA